MAILDFILDSAFVLTPRQLVEALDQPLATGPVAGGLIVAPRERTRIPASHLKIASTGAIPSDACLVRSLSGGL
jgi:hypothetical protein